MAILSLQTQLMHISGEVYSNMCDTYQYQEDFMDDVYYLSRSAHSNTLGISETALLAWQLLKSVRNHVKTHEKALFTGELLRIVKECNDRLLDA